MVDSAFLPLAMSLPWLQRALSVRFDEWPLPAFLVPPVIPIAVIAAPFFLALSDPVSGLDDLNCWLFASTSHIRFDRGNMALDYCRQQVTKSDAQRPPR